MTRNCDYCSKEYSPDLRNFARGWGRCCSKSCAAYMREHNRLGIQPVVAQEPVLTEEQVLEASMPKFELL